MWCKLNNIPPPTNTLTSLGLCAYQKLYKRSKPPVWFTEDQINSILDTFNHLQLHHYALLPVSFYTLVRPREILFLRWHHVFLTKKYIWLPVSKNDQEGAGTYVRLLPPALAALTYLNTNTHHSPSDLVFPVNQSSLNGWLEAKCSAANVPPYNWYAIKHGGATHLALCGWSIDQIQAHGRWKTREAARVYIHAPILA